MAIFFFNSSEEPCQMHVMYKNLWSPHGDEGGKRDQVMNMVQEAAPEEAKAAFLGWVQLTVMLMMVSYLEGRRKRQQFY